MNYDILIIYSNIKFIMDLKFFAFLSLTSLVSFIVAIPYNKADFASELGRTDYFEEPHEVKRAPCRNARDDYYCFLEAMYDDACSSSPGDMRMKCAKECGFC
ncbi:hypothetical protein OS493_023705 [Desmophyllum pertusum]|uniref:Uncharacterized protein n=1 Tax=Desmophyllum pertusum TaxID=174260 RepID=A0A9W9YZP8_9CNID|nr:hypothetical protein OS493_023705 [Desmophyllum pertusum]